MDTQTIVVEAVSDKFKNKFNSGSVLAGGKWMQVSSNLDLSQFTKDREMTVKTKTNAKGYTSIVDVVEDADEATVEAVKEENKQDKKELDSNKTSSTLSGEYFIKNGYGKVMSKYEIDLDRRISRAGIIQAVTQSPSLAGLPFTSSAEVVNNIKSVSLELIKFLDEQTK